MKGLKRFLLAKFYVTGTILFTTLAHAEEAADTAQQGMLFSTEIGTAKKLLDLLMEFCVKYSFQALGGIIVLVLGLLLAKVVVKFLQKFLTKHNVDVTVSKFICGIVKMIVIALAALVALGKFGITMAPFIAGLSVIGFGTSFALQGPLSNYAAGITLIFTKPFKVGDIIEVTDVMGEVQDMTLARTELKTVDGTKIVIPNKHILGEVIHNYSDNKKLDITIGISYDSSVEKAIAVFTDIVSKDKRVAQSPKPKIGISEFADSSINIYARLWCKQSDFWDVKFDIHKQLNDQLKSAGVTIPFPQRDVHIYEEK